MLLKHARWRKSALNKPPQPQAIWYGHWLVGSGAVTTYTDPV
jgi:hypothetical protein